MNFAIACTLMLLFVAIVAVSANILPENVELSNVVLVKGGTIVNANSQEKADVLIVNNKIYKIAKNIPLPDVKVKVVDATGKYVMPGGIDPHTHMELPFMGTVAADDFYTGTRAALAGGTTMIIDFAIPPPQGSHLKIYEDYRKKADAKVCADYGLHIGVVHFNDEVKKEMKTLVDEKGINSFKFFMAYKGAFMLDDDKLPAAMAYAAELKAIPQVHAENGELVIKGQQKLLDAGVTGPEGHPQSRPDINEGEATHRALSIAYEVNAPLYVVHVMSKMAMEAVQRAKLRGQVVFGEPIAGGLTLDDSMFYDPSKTWEETARYVMSPPIRKKKDQEALVSGIQSGILDLVATDHAAFTTTQKKMGRDDFTKIPNGIPTVEDRMNVVYDRLVTPGLISPMDYVRITSTKAAQIFNVYPQKGAVMEGSDADLIVMDPNATKVLTAKNQFQNVDYNAFEGRKIKGVVTVTISRGKVVFENGKLNVEKGAGKFVPTPANSPFVYGRSTTYSSPHKTPRKEY